MIGFILLIPTALARCPHKCCSKSCANVNTLNLEEKINKQTQVDAVILPFYR